MLGYTSVLYGQSLMENSKGNNAMRRQAIEQFVSSARSVFLSLAILMLFLITAPMHCAWMRRPPEVASFPDLCWFHVQLRE